MKIAPALATLIIGMAGSARAAIVHDLDQHESSDATAEVGFDATIAAGSHRYLLAAIITGGADAPVRTASFGGASLGPLGAASTPRTGCRVEWWGLVDPPMGTHPFRVDVASVTEQLGVSLVSYSGVHPLGAVSAVAHASGPRGPSAVTVPSAADELVVEATCGWSPDSVLAMAGPDQDARWHWSSRLLSTAGSSKPGAASVDLSWTESGTGTMAWATVGLSLRPDTAHLDLGLDVDGNGCTFGGRGRPAGCVTLAVVLALTGTFSARRRATLVRMRMGASRVLSAPEEASDSDEITLARAKAGDPRAQTALIHRYERPVFALLWRIVGPQRELVEDLTQETFLRVLRALPRFDRNGRARLITWILTIATRLALDHLRASKPRPDTELSLGGTPVALPAPDQEVERHRLAGALVQAVGTLGAPFRAAFLLREVHGLSYDEISLALEIDVGTVKSRLARARAALQSALAEVHDG